ncbi:hypothetical protein BU15DRAFT_52628, partial [Melanogaster broomeanus]
PGALTITSQQHRSPHLPADQLRLPLVMLEVMDDLMIFGSSIEYISNICFHLERFQAAYGWTTAWSKSNILLLNVHNSPDSLLMPSVDPADLSSPSPVMQPVHVITSHAEFLKTQVNDPHHQFQLLHNLISSFQFPDTRHRLPFTALRKILSQLLISRVRPRLACQTIRHQDARFLDMHLTHCVHDYLSFPFHFNSALLNLPLELFGFGFPSISRLNAAAAVSGLQRDLNHHVPIFRDMAHITLADWTCSLTKCSYPLTGPGLSRDFSRTRSSLPFSWIMAHNTLRSLHISLLETDQSYWLTGDVSLAHIAHLQNPVLHPSHVIVANLARAGFTHLHQTGSWNDQDSGDPRKPTFRVHAFLSGALRFTSAEKDWGIISSWLSSLTLPRLAVGDDASLALSPLAQQAHAQRLLLALHSISYTPGSSLATHPLVASDASMVPSAPLIHHPRSVHFSTVSPSSSFTASLASFGRSATILHGEVYGIICALLLALRDSPPSPIITDHLSSVHLIHSFIQNPDSACSSLRANSARSLYHWLFTILPDLLATSSQNMLIPPPPVPVPSFCMDAFTFHHSAYGFIESKIANFISHQIALNVVNDPQFHPSQMLPRVLYDSHSPPEYSYVHAKSAYSVVVQLYARSSQFDASATRYKRLGDTAYCCQHCCHRAESSHHIFAHCPSFAVIRGHHSERLVCDTGRTLSNEPSHIRDVFCDAVSRLFQDDLTLWPQFGTRYYFGALPSLPKLANTHKIHVSSRTLHRLAHLWHTHSVRLAGRIWGEYKWRRRMLSFCLHSSSTLSVPDVFLPEHLANII